MKGYPDSRAAAKGMVSEAEAHGFEAVCIRITNIDEQMLDFSRARGVWHLSRSLRDRTPEQWRRLSIQGLKGLLTTRQMIPVAGRAVL